MVQQPPLRKASRKNYKEMTDAQFYRLVRVCPLSRICEPHVG